MSDVSGRQIVPVKLSSPVPSRALPRSRFRAVAIGLVCLATAHGRAVSGAEIVDYERQVKPLLKQRCYACHGALKRKARLRLDTGGSIRQGGDGGPAVEPGRSEESLLLDRVTSTDASFRMPPEGSPLTPEQVAILRAWIDQGATSPKNEAAETDPRKHWAFLPPVRPKVPAVHDASANRNPIDALLEEERRRENLTPLGRSRPYVLLRRVFLDLIGLPPTRAELQEFLRDPSDASYERIVDRLLADPRHGERWARHWMDVWRYSDWYGRRAVPDVLNSYGQIWRWRDWIVRSLNEDRGYDEMVRAMLAADELAPNDPSETVATGFLVRNFYRWNYNSWMKDNVEHTGKAFLALTFNCAHCHDHKYDPIKNEDYFALRAVFEPIEIRHDRLPGEPDPGAYPNYEYGKAYKPITSGLARVYDKDLEAKTFVYTRGESRNIVAGRPPVAPGMPAFLGRERYRASPVELPPEVAFPGMREFVRREEISAREASLARADESLAKAREAAAKVKAGDRNEETLKLALKLEEATRSSALADLSAIHARISADDAKGSGPNPTFEARKLLAARAEKWAATRKAAVNLAKAELDLVGAKAKSPEEAAKAKPKVDAAQKAVKGAEAELAKDSTDYAPLSPVFPSKSTGRRTALARWITQPSNPLTARVAINHIWRRHFGTPIVATTADFGRNGAPPTHPKLLDWLAVELMNRTGSGDAPWSMKAIHRLIVLSEAYRMESRPAPEHAGRRIDPENRVYWRFPVNRMEAEEVRDGLLSAGETLDAAMGGADIDLGRGLVSRRRSLYFTHHGESRMPFLETFDAPDACDAYRRTSSVVPQQALALVNNDFLVDLSRGLSERLWNAEAIPGRDPAECIEAFVSAGFESILSRPPTLSERRLSADFLSEQAGIVREELAVNASGSTSGASPEATARRDFIHALFNHTDFLTIH